MLVWIVPLLGLVRYALPKPWRNIDNCDRTYKTIAVRALALDVQRRAFLVNPWKFATIAILVVDINALMKLFKAATTQKDRKTHRKNVVFLPYHHDRRQEP